MPAARALPPLVAVLAVSLRFFADVVVRSLTDLDTDPPVEPAL